MDAPRPYDDGMKTKHKKIDFELLKRLSANGIKIKPSLLKFCKRLGIFLSLLFVFHAATAQTQLKKFNATFTGRKVKLFWSATNENNVNYFTLERSSNGKTFETIGLIKANDMDSGQDNFTFIDKDYYENIIYYRLKISDNYGKQNILGGIVALQMKEETKSIYIYPFSNIQNMVYIDVSQINSEKIIVDATDADGQKLASKELDKTQNEIAVELKTTNMIQYGDYTITAFYDNHVLKSKLTIQDSSMNLSEDSTPNNTQIFTLK